MQRKILNLTLIIVTFISAYILLPITVNAEVKTYNREELENYGVNKKWNINTNNKDNILKTYEVDSNQKIYDFSDVLTDEEEQKLTDRMYDFTEKYKIDIVILVDNYQYTQDSQNTTFATDFYDYNDFGINFEKYDGVMLFRNTYEQNPYFDAYSFGNAQLYFYDTRLSNALDYIYDDLHNESYYEGFNKFIDKMEEYYNEGKLTDYYVDDSGFLQKQKTSSYYLKMIGLSMLIALIITGIIIYILIKKNKMILKATKATVYMNKEKSKITNVQDNFVTSNTTSYVISSDTSSGGGHSSSGGSSGGGFSSGGGRHG